MKRKLLFGLVLAAVVVGAVLVLRGGSKSPPARTSPAGTIAVKAYFYRGPALVPVVVKVPQTRAVATAALRALLAGPPAGLQTAIPAGATLSGVAIARGIATADFSHAVANAPRTAQAQIVYTLTQFPSVHAAVIDAEGTPVSLSNDAGETIYTPAGRADYADLTPDALIFVASPARDSTVTSPVHVSGTAVAFEATIVMEVWSGATRLYTDSITTSAGAPERGTWSKTLVLAPRSYRLVVYEPSAENGSHLHTTTVGFRVGP